jgi:hypothetical protein
MRWTRADAKVACQAQMRKYRREDRMRWTRADAEVACQDTDAKVQDRRQDEMDKILYEMHVKREQTVTDH